MLLTIIIPVYNEEDNINRLESELLEFKTSSQITSKILFVDDGSTDNSLEKIEAICNKHSDFGFLAFTENKGLSTALKAGFDFCDTEYLGYIDADLQTSPKDFDLLFKYMGDYDLVTGVRVNRNDSFSKKIASKIANFIRRRFTHDQMDDTGCPLKIIKTEYAKRIPMFRGLHRFLPAMVLLQNGNIKQVPVQHFSRQAGRSKFGMTNRLFGPLLDCFAYLWMKRKYINYTIDKIKV